MAKHTTNACLVAMAAVAVLGLGVSGFSPSALHANGMLSRPAYALNAARPARAVLGQLRMSGAVEAAPSKRKAILQKLAAVTLALSVTMSSGATAATKAQQTLQRNEQGIERVVSAEDNVYTVAAAAPAKTAAAPAAPAAKSSKKKGSFFKTFIKGGISATISKTATAPIERIKLLMQVQATSAQITTKYSGILDCASRVYAEQGLSAFWRGNTANIIRYFPTQALNFAFKDKFKEIFVRPASEVGFWMFFLGNLASGGAAGATSLLIVYPLDFARTRLGADIGKGDKRQFNGIFDCIAKIYKSDGFGGLYQGFAASIYGIIVYRAAFFGGFDTMKSTLITMGFGSAVWQAFLVAQVTTAIAGIISYPFDTVRRRLMMKSGGGSTVLYKGTWDCVVKIVQQEGFGGLFNGALSNTFRGFGAACVLVLYDYLTKIIG